MRGSRFSVGIGFSSSRGRTWCSNVGRGQLRFFDLCHVVHFSFVLGENYHFERLCLKEVDDLDGDLVKKGKEMRVGQKRMELELKLWSSSSTREKVFPTKVLSLPYRIEFKDMAMVKIGGGSVADNIGEAMPPITEFDAAAKGMSKARLLDGGVAHVHLHVVWLLSRNQLAGIVHKKVLAQLTALVVARCYCHCDAALDFGMAVNNILQVRGCAPQEKPVEC